MNPAKSITLFAIFLLILGAAANAVAVPITFVHTGMGSGTLDDGVNPVIDFNGEDFVITATGDTDDRDSFPGGFSIDHLTAQIEIHNVGTLQFVTPTRTFVNNDNEIVGFSRATTSGLDLFNGPTDVDFAAWDMLSSIGPIFGDASLLQWGSADVETDQGVLFFDNHFVESASFTARVEGGQPAPEPVSWTLMALGLLGVGLSRRRS